MKKLFTLALAALLLSACGGNGGSGYSDKVLSAAEDGKFFHAAGGFADDNWKPKEENKMEATSIAAVAKLSTAVADKLAAKSVKYLYMKTVEFGKAEAGWTASAYADGEWKQDGFDGSFTVKAIRSKFNDEEGVYAQDDGGWIPDPKLSHAESLTPETLYMPKWVEEKDENGASWADNPVVISGAGTYTFVVAQYTNASAPDVAGYGLAVIK